MSPWDGAVHLALGAGGLCAGQAVPAGARARGRGGGRRLVTAGLAQGMGTSLYFTYVLKSDAPPQAENFHRLSMTWHFYKSFKAT